MWLCTQHGFFSIVRKGYNEVHVRARVRADIERLHAVLSEEYPLPPEILELSAADYRYRLICGEAAFEHLMKYFTETLDYSNFKGRISSLPDQRHKMGDYHRLWEAGVCWQNETHIPQHHIDRLIRTSVDDLKSGLWQYIASDIPLLQAAHDQCVEEGMKTKAAHLQRRIKQLSR